MLGIERIIGPVYATAVRVPEQQRGGGQATGVTRRILIVPVITAGVVGLKFAAEIRGEVEVVGIASFWIHPLVKVNIDSRADGVSAFDIGQRGKEIESVPVAGKSEPIRAEVNKITRAGKAVGGDVQEAVRTLDLIVEGRDISQLGYLVIREDIAFDRLVGVKHHGCVYVEDEIRVKNVRPLSRAGFSVWLITAAVRICWIRIGNAGIPEVNGIAALLSPAKRERVRIARVVVDLDHCILPEIVLQLVNFIVVAPGSIPRSWIGVRCHVAQIRQNVRCNWIDPIGGNLVARECRVHLLRQSIIWIDNSMQRREWIVNRQRLQTVCRSIPIGGCAEVASDPGRVRNGVAVVAWVRQYIPHSLIAGNEEQFVLSVEQMRNHNRSVHHKAFLTAPVGEFRSRSASRVRIVVVFGLVIIRVKPLPAGVIVRGAMELVGA